LGKACLLPGHFAAVATGAKGSCHERDGRTHSPPVPDRAALWRSAGFGWMFLLTCIAWLIASVLILRITTASVATVAS
jgi:hypothetical protein